MNNIFSFSNVLPLLALALATACGTGGGSGDEQVTVLRADLQAARAEVARHETACASATSLGAVSAELSLHEQHMGQTLNDLDSDLAGMSHCNGAGMMHMNGMMGDMHGTVSAHESALGQDTTLSSAQAQCSSYTDAMNQMIDSAFGTLGDMRCSMMGMMYR